MPENQERKNQERYYANQASAKTFKRRDGTEITVFPDTILDKFLKHSMAIGSFNQGGKNV